MCARCEHEHEGPCRDGWEERETLTQVQTGVDGEGTPIFKEKTDTYWHASLGACECPEPLAELPENERTDDATQDGTTDSL